MFFYKSSRVVKEIGPSDFHHIKEWELQSKKCSVLLVYADWCGHCKTFRDTYEEFGRQSGHVDVLAINGSHHSALMSKIGEDMPGLSGLGFPTILFFANGKPTEVYTGPRDVANLMKASMRVCASSSR